MVYILISFLAALATCAGIIYTSKYHGRFTLDFTDSGVQKVHAVAVPRVGGLAIFVSMAFVAVYGAYQSLAWAQFYASIIGAIFFVFLGGITEDLSKLVSPMVRIGFMMASVIFALFITHSIPLVRHTANATLDGMLAIDALSFILTSFMVVGLSNAINIIDGYNGLASTASIFNLLGLAFLAWKFGDSQILVTSLSVAMAMLGFWVINYPRGKIFLGDGGAYLTGFVIAALSINLAEFHNSEISPYAVILLAIYPITEIFITIVRRKFVHKTISMGADRLHLHHLVFERCLPSTKELEQKNAWVLPIMLLFILPQFLLVILFYNNHLIMLAGIGAYLVFYIYFYQRLVQFRTPRFLVFK